MKECNDRATARKAFLSGGRKKEASSNHHSSIKGLYPRRRSYSITRKREGQGDLK